MKAVLEREETQNDRGWLAEWWQTTFLDLAQQMRWSYLPPLMVYFAAGVSGLTSVVGAFFLKDYLDLSASFVAGLAVLSEELCLSGAGRSHSFWQ